MATIVGDEAGTYFERHENYERRLREGSHRWAARRMVPLSFLWRKRFVAIGAISSAMGSIALLGYVAFLMFDGQFFLILENIALRNTIVAGVGLLLVAFVAMATVRLPLCMIYFQVILILAVASLHFYLVGTEVVLLSSLDARITKAWDDANDNARVQVEKRLSCCGMAICSPEAKTCLRAMHEVLESDLGVIMAMGTTIASLQLLTSWAILLLARSVAKQPSSFGIL